MSLFPRCTFRVLLPGGGVTPGARLDGILEVTAPEPIERAEHLDLRFESIAWAGYGSGKSRTVVRRTMFFSPLHLDVPGKVLPAGTHRIPFAIDVPAWLPPELEGPDCGIRHEMKTRLDVDWAIDPVARLAAPIVIPPREGARTPQTFRSPAGFHETVVVEVTLASSVIAQGEDLVGQIALRSGHDARFDAAVLSLAPGCTIAMGRGDLRLGDGVAIRVPDARLRHGEAVPFTFPANAAILPSFRSSFIDHDLLLSVSLDVPWAIDPCFRIPVTLLPAGSTLHGDLALGPVGGARRHQTADAQGTPTGLALGRPPVLVEGALPPVAVRITDAPRKGAIGLDVDYTFPELSLGIRFRELGMLEGFRESPLLPPAIAARYLLRCEPPEGAHRVGDEALRAFFDAILHGVGPYADLRLSDHHLGLRVALPDDAGACGGRCHAGGCA